MIEGRGQHPHVALPVLKRIELDSFAAWKRNRVLLDPQVDERFLAGYVDGCLNAVREGFEVTFVFKVFVVEDRMIVRVGRLQLH